MEFTPSSSLSAQDDANGTIVSVHVCGSGGCNGLLSMRMPMKDATIWVEAMKLHSTPGSLSIRGNNDSSVARHACSHEITIDIEGRHYTLEVPMSEQAGEVAQQFIIRHSVHSDYLPAVEMEVLRAQLQLHAQVPAALMVARTASIAARSAVVEAEGRARRAEEHAALLSRKLTTVEALLPLALNHRAVKGDGISGIVDVLRGLCAEHGVSAGHSGDGAVVDATWATLLREEAELGISSQYSEGLMESEDGGRTWRARYEQVRAGAADLAARLQRAEAALSAARLELQGTGTSRAMESALAENQSLREQTVKLRGEILRLRDNIAEVKQAAALAMQSVSVLGKDVARLPQQPDGAVDDSNTHVSPASAQRSQDTAMKPAAAPHPVEVSPLQDGYSPEQRAQSDPAAPLPPAPPTAEYTDALELALRAAHVPIVCDRLLRLLFDRYNSQDGRFLMNSFRYLRCLKECGITANEDEVAVGHNSTRWLSYGVVSIVFNEALKAKTEDSAVAVGAASASAPNSYVRSTSTVLTLKGAADSRASAISHQQFLGALRALALRLYADVIEEEFGVPVELLKDPVRDTAAYQALELLVQDKLVPFAVKHDFMPWPLVHLERTLFALQHIPAAFSGLAAHSDALTRWFLHYAVSAASPTGPSGPGPRPAVARTLFEAHRLSPQDTASAALTYKALSRFAHDFGVVPFLIKEPELFGLFQELMLWTSTQPSVASDALPPRTVEALSGSLNRLASPDRLGALPRVKGTVERVSLASFAVAVCIVAMQGFPREADGARLGKLLQWLHEGGGPSIVARSEKADTFRTHDR